MQLKQKNVEKISASTGFGHMTPVQRSYQLSYQGGKLGTGHL